MFNNNVVETTEGKIRGERRGRITRFRGVPYGQPVSGAARFLPALAAKPWSGVRDAFELGPACPQNRNATMSLFALSEVQTLVGPAINITQPMDENCLALNVWTPASGGTSGKKPVMVWLHGGGFFAGSSGSPCYDGERLSDVGDVVVVSLNHRINVFGFLYLAEIAGEEYRIGNVGLFDIILALKWVQANIAHFGGDASNITIFGESGGGGKVSVLGSMHAAKGLFHKAIVQSGSSTSVLSKDDATAMTEKLIKGAGLQRSEWKRLLDLPAAKLTAAGVSDPALVKLGPVADGFSISREDLLQGPPAAGVVPMIIGTTHDEARLLFAFDQEAFTTDAAGLRARVIKLTGKSPADADLLIAAYVKGNPEMAPADIFFLFATDLAMRNNAVHQAEHRVASGAPVYMYRFDWKSPLFGGKYGAVHAVDLPFVFDMPDSLGTTGSNPARFALAEAVSKAWARFSWTGDPNHAGIPTWPRYDPATRWTMLFDEKSKAVEVGPIVQPIEKGRGA